MHRRYPGSESIRGARTGVSARRAAILPLPGSGIAPKKFFLKIVGHNPVFLCSNKIRKCAPCSKINLTTRHRLLWVISTSNIGGQLADLQHTLATQQ